MLDEMGYTERIKYISRNYLINQFDSYIVLSNTFLSALLMSTYSLNAQHKSPMRWYCSCGRFTDGE